MLRSKRVALIGVFTALGVSMRLAKHVLLGPIQFINIPAIFTIIAGALIGPVGGFIVGVGIFVISDMYILPGIWTVMTSFTMGLVGYFSGLIWHKRQRIDKLELIVIGYLMMLFYDIVTSIVLYIIIGFPILYAIVIGIIGLFFPVAGGYMVGIGVLTEVLTVLTISLLLPYIKENVTEVSELE